MVKFFVLLTVMALLLASACGPGARTVSETLLEFMEAVQREDIDSLFCLSAGATEAPELGSDEAERRTRFNDWARSQYDFYVAGRQNGRVELEGHGIVEAKLFSLGKGAFYSVGPVRRTDDDALEVETELRFGYSRIDLSRLSPGTTFYLCGLPLGRVHPIRVPAVSREVNVEVLRNVTLRWTLVRRRASALCPEGWAVAAVEALEDSASAEMIGWSF
jgi:hypothetical protein